MCKGSCFAIVAIALAPSVVSAQAVEEWVSVVSGGEGRFVALDPGGNVVVAGPTSVVKLDPAGVLIWARNNDVTTTGIAVDSGGNILIAGYDLFDPSDSRSVTLKLGPDGTEAWRQVYDTAGAFDNPVGVVVDDLGRVVIGGTSESAGNSASTINAFIVAYDANGVGLWQDTYDNGPDQEIIYDIARDRATGAIYLAGGVSGKSGGALVLRYDADGRRRWAKKYPTHDVQTFAEKITVGPNGRVALAGFRSGPPNPGVDLQVWLVDGASGKLAWSSVYGGPSADERVMDLTTDGAGNVFVAATALGISSAVDAVLLKFSANGALSWANVTDAGLYDAARAVAVDGSGNAYFTGTSQTFDGPFYDFQWFTTRYDATGATAWTAIYDGTPYGNVDESPGDVVVAANGDVIVTGSMLADTTTIRYQQP